MKIRFKLNQSAAFRAGIDCPKSIVSVDVDPAALSQEDRDLLADRLDGIDVCQGVVRGTTVRPKRIFNALGKDTPILIETTAPTFETLMDAVKRDQESLASELASAQRLAKYDEENPNPGSFEDLIGPDYEDAKLGPGDDII